jgi:hypothetical protein
MLKLGFRHLTIELYAVALFKGLLETSRSGEG